MRQRQLGTLELAFYWFALMAPPSLLVAASLGGVLANSYGWDPPRAYFMAFLCAWLLLAVAVWFFSGRRGPGLNSPAIALYWLGLCLPWLWTPAANYFYSGVLGWAPFYVRPLSGDDYSGYAIALLLAAAGTLFVIRRWPRRAPGEMAPPRNSDQDFAVSVGWLVLMTILTLALVVIFNGNSWDWVGAVYDSHYGGSATGALIALLLVGSAFALGRKNAPLGEGEARIYWLGSTAVAILAAGTWFAAKEINWLGMTDPILGGLWTGIWVALGLSLAFFLAPVRALTAGRLPVTPHIAPLCPLC